MPADLYLAHVRRLARRYVKQNIHLLRGRIGSALRRNPRAVVTVLLHELGDVLQRAIQSVHRVQFAQLELRCIYDLVIVWPAGRALHVDRAYKKVQRRGKGKPHLRAYRRDFGLNIGKTPRGKKHANTLAHLVAVQRLPRLLRQHAQHMIAVRNSRQFNGLHAQSRIAIHGSDSRRCLRRLSPIPQKRRRPIRHGLLDRAKSRSV